uniref:Uncharacterized protein n=1 Tax=viral metagenome TaxID=1070528 RepID=A0A6M3JW40_9ZZZZ
MSVDLASNALITVEEFLRYKKIPDTDTVFDQDRCRFLINGVSQEIANYCGGRIFISPSAQISEIFDGNDSKERFVRHRRIADNDTPVIYYWSGTDWTEATSSVYPRAIGRTRARIYFTHGDVFGSGSDNWKIAYKPGWTQSALPDDLKFVCLAIVDRQIKLAEDKEGLDSQSFGDSTTSYNLAGGIPGRYKPILDAYRIIPIG